MWSLRVTDLFRIRLRGTRSGAQDAGILDLSVRQNALNSKRQPTSPGEMRAEEFFKSLGMSNWRPAKEIGVPAHRISGIVASQRAIAADTGRRLCRVFAGLSGWWQRWWADCAEFAKVCLAKERARLHHAAGRAHEARRPARRHQRLLSLRHAASPGAMRPSSAFSGSEREPAELGRQSRNLKRVCGLCKDRFGCGDPAEIDRISGGVCSGGRLSVRSVPKPRSVEQSLLLSESRDDMR